MILAKHLLPFRLRRPEPETLPEEDVDLSGLDDEDMTAVMSLADIRAKVAEARRQHLTRLRAQGTR